VLTGATGLGFGWINQLNASGQVITWVSIPTGIAMLVEVLRGVPNFVTYQDPVIAGFRLAGQVATALVLLRLWLRAGRDGWVRALGLSLLVVVFLGPVVQPWYVLWGLTVLATTRIDRRIWLVGTAGSFWLSMMIAPQGSNLFLEPAPVVAMAVAATVATLAVLGRSPGEPGEPASDADPGRTNALVVAPVVVGGRDLGKPVASVP
jgi:alpha-1,6-mannosyltransferase